MSITTKNTLRTIANVSLAALLTIGSYSLGRQREINKHKNDYISISVDYEGQIDRKNPNGQRISVYGNLGGETFGLLDISKYSEIRDNNYNLIPKSVDSETHFKMLDSIVKAELDKDITRWPYNARLKTTVDTGYDVRLELRPK